MQTNFSSCQANVNPSEFLRFIMECATLSPTTGALTLHTCVPVCLFPTVLTSVPFVQARSTHAQD